MATGKVNKRSVDAFKPGASASFLWDDDLKGFGVKANPSGSLSYVLQYRMGGREAKTRRYMIGGHGNPWTPASARTEAERLLMLVAQGIDPVEADRKRRDDAVNLAFSAYADRFRLTCKGRWGDIVERSIRLHAKPVLAHKPLPAITKADIVAVFDAMPAGQQANRRNLFAILRRMFRWVIGRGDLERSPMESMETPPAVKARDRWLSDDELERVWNALPSCHRCYQPIVRLLIATGQRREEVAGLQWPELDRTERVWRLPGERAKNGVPTTIPLNDLAIAELDAVAKGDKWPRRGGVFLTAKGGPFESMTRGKAKLDETLAASPDEPIAPWRLHDLRRTVATGLQRLGVRFEVTEAVLNHVGGSRAGVAGVYQRHDWKQEKRDALDAWGRHVAACLSGVGDETNVVPLAARRA